MADNPYDLSGLYGDTPAPPQQSAPKKKSDPYDLSGLYEESKPAPAPKVQAPPMQAAPQSIGAKILNAPGVGSTLEFLNNYAVQPFEKVAARAGDIGGEALVQAGRRASQSALASGQVGPRVEPTIQTLINPPALPGPVEGVERAVGEVGASVAADPRNWPFLGSAAIKNVLLKRATQVGFTALMSKGAIDQAEQIGAEWDSATPEQRAEQLTKLGINVAGAVGAGGELGKPVEAPRLPVQGSPRLNFLQPMIDNAPREGTPPLLNAEAAESAVQPKLDVARAERQAVPAEQAKAELQKPALPIDETPSTVTPPKAEPSLYDLDALYNEPKQAPTLRVGEEVPGLDQQAEQIASRSQNEGIRAPNESSPENAPQGDLSLRGEERANPSENVQAEQGAPVAQESTPLQAEVHPKYEQIGIDADSGQPILKQKAERRLDTSERKRVSQMSPEEMQQELLTSESLNLPNKRAFLEEEARNPSPAISMSDADGLKAFNDKFGYEYGNKLLEAKAEALKEAGLDAYHEKGDEFLQRDGSPEDLQNKLEKAREILRNKEIKVTLDDGTIKKYKGVDFSYGVGKDLSEAEANLKQHKADREARGERARGELRGITEVRSQAGPVDRSGQPETSPAGAEASQPQGSVETKQSPAEVDRAKAQAAKQRLNEKLGRSHAGVPVDAIPDLLEYGYYTFKAGARTFAEWSAKMLKDFGEQVRPHLKKAWDDIQEKIANGEEIPKPKNLARGSAAVAEKPKPLSFLKNPEAQKSGGTPPKVPTFLKTESAPEGQPRYAGSINLYKLGVPEEVKRDYEVAYEKAQPEIDAYRRGKISNEKLVSMARDLGLTDKDLAGWKKGGAKNAETLFAAREVVAGARQAARDASNKFLKSHSPEDLLAAQEAAAKALLVQTKLSGAASEAGRALNQFRIIAEARKQLGKTNYEKVADSLREKLGDQWNEVAKEVTIRLTQIPETDVLGLNKFLRHFADFTTADKVQAYFITNILSGPPTHERNFVSNQVFGLMQIPDRAVAAAVDAPLAKVFGRNREVYAREVVPAAIGYLTGLPEGLRRAAYIIQRGFDRAEAGKLEVPRNYEFLGGAKNPFNQVSRLLLASDAVNKSMHLHAELRALGTRQAIKEGLQGSKLIDRALELANNPTTEMMDKAITYSRWATFNAKPDAIQRALAGLANIHLGQTPYKGVGANFKPLKFVVPFVGVPYQIGKLGLVDYSPVGFLKLTDAKVRSSGESSFVVARALIGSSILAGLAPLAASGKITGAAPSQPEQRDAFYRAGKQPFSIKIGNRWVAYNQTAGPFANHLAAVAAFHDAFAETGEIPTTKRVMQALGVIGQSELDASFFKGLSNMIDAIREPERSGDSFATSLSQGFVPFSGFLRTATNAKDNIIRDPQTVYERIKTGIPVLSETVPAKVDTLGREVRRSGAEGALAFLPSRIPKDEPQSKVDEELTRLGVTLSSAGNSITVQNKKFELSKDQQRELQKSTGSEINQALINLFTKGAYKELSDEKKSIVVDKLIRAAREKARAQYIQRIHTEDLQLKPKTRSLPYFLGQPAS